MLKKLQITIAIITIMVGLLTVIAGILYLKGICTNLGFPMMGLILCCLCCSVNCVVSLIVLKNKK